MPDSVLFRLSRSNLCQEFADFNRLFVTGRFSFERHDVFSVSLHVFAKGMFRMPLDFVLDCLLFC